jgi:hypothetical protein
LQMAEACWVNFNPVLFCQYLWRLKKCSLGKQISGPVMHKSRAPTRPGDHFLYSDPSYFHYK